MLAVPFELAHDDNNPLDLIEDLAESRQWKFVRDDETFMSITLPGQNANYDVALEWQEEFSSLLFAVTLKLEIAEAQYESAARTIEQINQNLWMGHFDLSNKGKFPTFRQTFLFRMIPAGIAIDIVNDAMEVALAECNRFYSTFQLVQAGDVRLHDNLSAAVFETVGEA